MDTGKDILMAQGDRQITLRRTIEQAIHCLVEAGSVLENNEDPSCARDDVVQALELIRAVILPGITKLPQPASTG